MAVGGGVTPTIASHALAEANRWLTGQIPQDSRGYAGHLVEWSSFSEFFKSSEVNYLEPCFFY